MVTVADAQTADRFQRDVLFLGPFQRAVGATGDRVRRPGTDDDTGSDSSRHVVSRELQSSAQCGKFGLGVWLHHDLPE